jgi:hypothetical protein
MYGVSQETMDLLLDDKIVPNKQAIYNTRTVLKELGLISKGKKGRWILAPVLEELKIKDTLNIMVQCKTQ